MNITPWDTIVSDDADDNDKYDKDLKMEDCYVNGYDYCVFSSDTNNKTSFTGHQTTLSISSINEETNRLPQQVYPIKWILRREYSFFKQYTTMYGR